MQSSARKPIWQQRKFRACVVGLVGLLCVHFGIAEINAEIWVGAVLVMVGMYTGTVSMEDGLTRLAQSLLKIAVARGAAIPVDEQDMVTKVANAVIEMMATQGPKQEAPVMDEGVKEADAN